VEHPVLDPSDQNVLVSAATYFALLLLTSFLPFRDSPCMFPTFTHTPQPPPPFEQAISATSAAPTAHSDSLGSEHCFMQGLESDGENEGTGGNEGVDGADEEDETDEEEASMSFAT
jgi:hypothetical protein